MKTYNELRDGIRLEEHNYENFDFAYRVEDMGTLVDICEKAAQKFEEQFASNRAETVVGQVSVSPANGEPCGSGY